MRQDSKFMANQAETDFSILSRDYLSRRGFLEQGFWLGTAAIVSSVTIPSVAAAGRNLFDFEPVAANSLDTVTVPPGFSWHIVIRWGDPLWSNAPAFDTESRGTGASQERAFGDNNDGMELFVHNGHTLLAVNNEFVNRNHIYGNRWSKLPENADDVRKGKAGHGVSIIEIGNTGGEWSLILDSPYNRRITADTPMQIRGPARQHAALQTAADPAGSLVLGTYNNCGSGRTPWQTFLTCEENFNGYFSSSDPDVAPDPLMARYGIKTKDWGYAWATADDRFDTAKHPNEPNRFGYVVEIDPSDPMSVPKKRTALGRLKHENAEVVLAADSRIVVYMGDDERGEYLYKYVSDSVYMRGQKTDHLLDQGSLYVAKFDDDGRGKWIPLTPKTTGFKTQAEICIYTRQAASRVGATTMDRPEWVAANPKVPEAYCCLSNNKNRGRKPNRGGDSTPVGGPNPRASNIYGQIVRWRPAAGDHGVEDFTWDLFVVAGNPTVHRDERAGSSNINADNMFNAPDGLAFDTQGRLWIQTDGKYSNAGDFAGHGNNQMLVGDPMTGEIQRFLVGPKQCEITGLTWSEDRTTLFVGIQHPGSRGEGNFPDGGTSVPRASVIAVRRDDGGIIG